tara:strand:- start:1587 stop:2102 length:516 start_codon:yes stop_codon:yes gene_type:complete
MADKNKIIENMHSYLTNYIEIPREEFSGMATCPFSKGERTRGRLLVDVFDSNSRTFPDVVKQMIEDGYSSGLFALFIGDTPAEIAEEDTVSFQSFLNKVLKRSGVKSYKSICMNPNDNLEVNGFNPRQYAPYFLINVAHSSELNKGRKSLTSTKYFDKMPEKYRKYLKMDL